jgi:tetratricopeptide (TPR) repeat protein
MSKYNRKQRGKQDEFVSFWHKAYQVAEPYLTKASIAILTAIVVLLVVWGVTSFYERKAQAAAEAFGRAVKVYDAELITDANPLKTPEPGEEAPTPRFKTEKERADAALAELDKLDKEHSGSKVARDALLFRAGVLYDLGRFDDAQAAYQKLLGKLGNDPSLAAVAREGSGLCDEARGKLDDALDKYRALEPKGAKDDFYRDRALYDQARIYLKKGDKKKAADALRDALAKVPGTPLKDEITAQLAGLEGS